MTRVSKALCLYVPFSRKDSFKPISRSVLHQLRNQARRAFDLAHWRLFGSVDTHHTSWENVTNSNVGDAAITVALEMLARKAGASATVNVMEVSWGSLTPALVDEINANAACVLVAGGYFVVRPDGSLNARARNDLPLLRRMRRPIIAAGLGVNFHLDAEGREPEMKPESIHEMREWFNLCAAVGLRDERSIRAARVAGIEAQLMPDPVLAMGATGPRPSTDPRCSPTIGVNLSFRTRGHGSLDRVLGAYIEALKAVQKTHDARFVHFLHADGERFIARTLGMAGLNLRSVGGAADQLLPEYAGLDLHVAQMMHSSILSVCAGTPVGVLAYDVKNIEFCRLIGLSDYVISETDASSAAIVELIERLLVNRSPIAHRLTEARDALRLRQNQFMNSFCKPLLT